jgi:hypothetical protein
MKFKTSERLVACSETEFSGIFIIFLVFPSAKVSRKKLQSSTTRANLSEKGFKAAISFDENRDVRKSRENSKLLGNLISLCHSFIDTIFASSRVLGKFLQL